MTSDIKIGDKKLMRFMGLDIGHKTIGVAISDELGITAQGLKTIECKSMEEDLKEINSIISRYDIKKIVVGMPINMDGTFGRQAEFTLQWIKMLEEKAKISVVTWDERLSTVEASKTLIKADISRKKRKKVIDKLAAIIILQGYLNHMRNRNDE